MPNSKLMNTSSESYFPTEKQDNNHNKLLIQFSRRISYETTQIINLTQKHFSCNISFISIKISNFLGKNNKIRLDLVIVQSFCLSLVLFNMFIVYQTSLLTWSELFCPGTDLCHFVTLSVPKCQWP